MAEKILVTRSSLPSLEEYTEELRSVFDSRWLTNMGEKHQALEQRLKEYLQVEQLCLFQNGHLALEMSLEAMGLQGEIITTPFTFASTTWAILRAGCIPVFCDIDPVTYTIDPSKIEALITERTCAILPVHVYGHVCDVDAIQEIADRHRLKVIYDAAHAFGVRCRGKSVAGFGDLSMFSFHATKVFHTIEGGAACFRDPALSDHLFRIKNFGIQENETYGIGGNGKMNEFEAAMGLCNLRHIDEELKKRERAYTRYLERLLDASGLMVSEIQAGVQSNYAYFPVLFDPAVFGEDRDAVCARLNTAGIFPRKYFYPCTNAFAFERGGNTGEALQETETQQEVQGEGEEKPGIFRGAQQEVQREAKQGRFREMQQEAAGGWQQKAEERRGQKAGWYGIHANAVLTAERFDPAATPIATRISEQVLTLPIYADIDTDTVDRICDILLGR